MKSLTKLISPLDNQVVQVRGFQRAVEDLNDMNALKVIKENGGNLDAANFEPKDTVMWNPLHFAVYSGHFNIV